MKPVLVIFTEKYTVTTDTQAETHTLAHLCPQPHPLWVHFLHQTFLMCFSFLLLWFLFYHLVQFIIFIQLQIFNKIRLKPQHMPGLTMMCVCVYIQHKHMTVRLWPLHYRIINHQPARSTQTSLKTPPHTHNNTHCWGKNHPQTFPPLPPVLNNHFLITPNRGVHWLRISGTKNNSGSLMWSSGCVQSCRVRLKDTTAQAVQRSNCYLFKMLQEPFKQSPLGFQTWILSSLYELQDSWQKSGFNESDFMRCFGNFRQSNAYFTACCFLTLTPNRSKANRTRVENDVLCTRLPMMQPHRCVIRILILI